MSVPAVPDVAALVQEMRDELGRPVLPSKWTLSAHKDIRRLTDALEAVEKERARLADDMTFIAEVAESWHRDDAAKGRALAVIADRSKAALNPEEDTTHQT